MELQGKTALITGGGGGIGGATALALAHEGCNVVIAGIEEDQIRQKTADLQAVNEKCAGYRLDLSLEEDISFLVRETLGRFNGIDILVTAAGVCVPRDFPDLSLDEWDKVMAINLRGVFIIGQQVMKIMAARKSGHIINISSSVATGAVPFYHASYGASKYGVVGLSWAMSEYGKKHHVKVTTVYPGIVGTDMTYNLPLEQFGEGQWFRQREKWMQPEDIAESIVFLLKQSERAVVHRMMIDITNFQ